jgi:hypothetical protein
MKASKYWQNVERVGLITAGIALICTLAGSVYATSSRVDTIHAKQLNQLQTSLASNAAEGSKLANQYASERSFDIFTQISAEKLKKAADQTVDKLAVTQADPDIENAAGELKDDGEDLSDMLAQLSQRPSIEKARILSQMMDELGQKLKGLES